MVSNPSTSNRFCRVKLTGAIIFLLLFNGYSRANENGLKFEVSFSQQAHSKEITGRVYVMISRDNRREPRLQIGTHGVPFWGKDVEQLPAGTPAVIDSGEFGYPLESIQHIPAGEYYVQGFVNIYTEFKRSDGHTLWMHNDQWEGQHWNRSPGNLHSAVRKIYLDPNQPQAIKLVCDQVIPPVEIPADTKWVKRIKFKSERLSKFWGQPIYLGATILLPKGYEENTKTYYPVNYVQGHFSLRAPYGFTPPSSGESPTRPSRGRAFSNFWMSDDCPRFVAVTFQHPTPYYDDSYAVNSPNNGPYGDAIIEELIPAVEKKFRIIAQPYARILSGGSTGGWESLALQIFHPEFFGGTFSLCPDPVDFNYFQAVNIYKDKNAYYKEYGWTQVPTPSDRGTDGVVRLTYKQRNDMERVMGTKGRSGEQIDIFEAVFGPIGSDGYTKPLFDKRTGVIDPEVAMYWKKNFDLHYYLEKNWNRIGEQLEGKLHIYTGDMDTYYLNPAVVRLESFLEKTKKPYYDGTVEYGDGQPHCWGPNSVELLKLMAQQVAKNAPEKSGSRVEAR